MIMTTPDDDQFDRAVLLEQNSNLSAVSSPTQDDSINSHDVVARAPTVYQEPSLILESQQPRSPEVRSRMQRCLPSLFDVSRELYERAVIARHGDKDASGA